MDAACYQLASPAGTIRLWVGASGVTAAPEVEGWRLDGHPVAPQARRAIRSVRDGPHLAGNPPRAFSGVYEIAGVSGRGPFALEVTVGDQRLRSSVRALPARLELDGDPLTVLLVSCFHHATDGGLYRRLVPKIVQGAHHPDLCLFMGDQVYLDLPTLQNFRDDPVWLAERFEQDYVRNWFAGSFAGGLAVGPMVFVPDDHEYWNNFPQPSAFIQNSWTEDGRDHWREAARAAFRGFQLGGDGDVGGVFQLDVEPLSFMLIDSRSDRDGDRTRLLGPDARRDLAAWARRLAGDPTLVAGVVVTGQSLVEDPAGTVKGSIADFALADYEGPYEELLGALTTIVDAGKQLLLLTGDVHWGRVCSVRDRRRDAVAMYEIISSPTSLVETVGADQVHDVIGAVKRWFAPGDPWPRHGDAAKPPSHLPHSGQRFRTATDWRGHRGNQCAVLRMTRRGAGVEVDYTFHPIAGTGDVPATTGRFELRRTA